MKNYMIGFIIGVAFTLLVLLIMWLVKHNTSDYVSSKRVEIGSVAEVQIDTIYIERNIEPIHITGKGKITKTKPSNIAKADTLDTTQYACFKTNFAKNLFAQTETFTEVSTFTSQLDTIFRNDTISIRYDFPQNYFMLSLRPKPDSILFKQIVVRQTPEKWWIKPIVAISGCALGVLIGCSVK